jgi:hypothetical protein
MLHCGAFLVKPMYGACGIFPPGARTTRPQAFFMLSGVFFTPDSFGLDGEAKNTPPSGIVKRY